MDDILNRVSMATTASVFHTMSDDTQKEQVLNKFK